MRVAVSGASGLIGAALAESLAGDGHEVVRLVRRAARRAGEVGWDPFGEVGALTGVDAVVHLAGAGIGERRWTSAYKREIYDSRVRGTATLASALARMGEPPRVFVSGSAVGFYGDAGERVLTEDDPAGGDFLARVCRDWEGAAGAAADAGIRTVRIRTGLVVSSRGGAFGRMLPLFRLGLGGPLGGGRQYWSLISLADEVAAIRHVIDTPAVSGPVNLVCPDPVTNREVTASLGRALHRPAVLPVPGPALRLALGEFARTGVLASQRVVPKRLLASGFTFAHPDHQDVIRQATHRV
ncbi:TIGR01777 family oxidoreductase [Actinomadura rayongensis]|uniref:TIGR01777 family protein n=1 Tax=Actinomadura rayongensis TaxID=1429076 RepID=A0A6I4W867_9ACTN|nr:TIGR01777 family protein [Actinomadura rayongensis]